MKKTVFINVREMQSIITDHPLVALDRGLIELNKQQAKTTNHFTLVPESFLHAYTYILSIKRIPLLFLHKNN